MKETDSGAAYIFKLVRTMREHISQSKTLGNFSMVQIRTLGAVAGRKNPSMKDIAEDMCITSPSATTIIGRLVKSGELRRVPDKNDRRIIRLSLTEKGDKLLQKGLHEGGEKMREILESVTPDERKKFLEILKKIGTTI